MANYAKHLSTGALVGAATSFVLDVLNQQKNIQAGSQTAIDWQKTLGNSLLGLGIGAIGGVLPDILEPATNPNHRKVFHSITTASLIGYGIYKVNNPNIGVESKHAVHCAAAGYFSHLLLDMDTPKGLPIL